MQDGFLTGPHGNPGAHLGVEVEPLQRVDDQRVLRQPVVHDGVQALQEGRRLDHRLVVGVVEALMRPERGPPRSAASQQQQVALASHYGELPVITPPGQSR